MYIEILKNICHALSRLEFMSSTYLPFNKIILAVMSILTQRYVAFSLKFINL